MKDHPHFSEEDPPGNQKHFALAIVKKQTFFGWNNRKTHPKLRRTGEYGDEICGYHAETHVLYKIPEEKRRLAKIFVCRVNKKGGFAMSKPCQHCTHILLKAGIPAKNIWYTNEQGVWQCLKKL